MIGNLIKLQLELECVYCKIKVKYKKKVKYFNINIMITGNHHYGHDASKGFNKGIGELNTFRGEVSFGMEDITGYNY